MYEEIKTQIKLNENVDYQHFTSKLLPNVKNIVGVRIPILRKMAKQIIKNNPYDYLENCKNETFEETMVEGLVIGNLKDDFNIVKKYIKRFVTKIDNWSVCDTFCSSLKITVQHKEEMFKMISYYLNSNKEFENRFAYVMLLNYYIEDKYIDMIFNILNKFSSEKYYTNMAKAWLIQACYLKYNTKTIIYLKENELDNWTHNMAIQKIIESKTTPDNEKIILRNLKRK